MIGFPATRRSGRPAPFALAVVLAALSVHVGCATAPMPPTVAPAITYEQKLSWILRLEDERILRDPVVAADTAAAPAAPVRAKASAAPAAPAPPRADLVSLLTDADARVRRRAALAIGRVGLRGGAAPLARALAGDPEPEVRQMAAFALGLLRDRSSAAALAKALADPSPVVRGRAAEALAAIGDTASVPAIGAVVSALAADPAVAAVAPDDLSGQDPDTVEAFRLGVLALGQLKAYDALAGAVLDRAGAPRVAWWPVAAAFQRTGDHRALGTLVTMTRGRSLCGRAFAARGLGALKDASALGALSDLAADWRHDPRSAISAVRALGEIGDGRAGPGLLVLLRDPDLNPLLRIEVVSALGRVRAAGARETLLNLLSSPAPAIRAAALGSLREVDPGTFLLALSSLGPDPDWTVRAALAATLGTMSRAEALPRLTAMLADGDARMKPAVLAALVTIEAPGVEGTLLGALTDPDPVVRAAAANGLGSLKPAGGARALAEAFRAAEQDDTYVARAAILGALAAYGAPAARPALREALADKDWAVRVRAAALLAPLEPDADPGAAIRPAPTGHPPTFYESPDLLAPSVSPLVYLDTPHGTITVEMAVLDAPLTCLNFMTLARRGFFKGSAWHRVVPNFVAQDGDPRGDGEGGPGYTIRDEINERPYLRGTMGMALDWADTGGSQFFLTFSPQPHLDGRYTVFGQVVAGLDVLDRIEPGDPILRVRVWDGKTMSGQ